MLVPAFLGQLNIGVLFGKTDIECEICFKCLFWIDLLTDLSILALGLLNCSFLFYRALLSFYGLGIVVIEYGTLLRDPLLDRIII